MVLDLRSVRLCSMTPLRLHWVTTEQLRYAETVTKCMRDRDSTTDLLCVLFVFTRFGLGTGPPM